MDWFMSKLLRNSDDIGAGYEARPPQYTISSFRLLLSKFLFSFLFNFLSPVVAGCRRLSQNPLNVSHFTPRRWSPSYELS